MSTPARESSIAYQDVVRPKVDNPMFPTWSIVLFLVATFFLLKTFIYIKDGNRHGK